MLGYVYKITNPEGKVYVGSTIQLETRQNSYRRNKNKQQIKIHRSIQKYGYEKHIFEVIWEGDSSEMLKNERLFGDQLNVMDRENGLNLILPGFNAMPRIISKETSERIGRSNIGKKQPKEGRLLVSLNHKRLSPSDITKKKLRDAKGKSIEQLDQFGFFIKKYGSTIEASEITGIGRSSIKECVNGRSKSAGGFMWRYSAGLSKSKMAKGVAKVNRVTGEVIELFDSISAAAISMDLDQKSISRVINSKGYTAAGFNWILT